MCTVDNRCLISTCRKYHQNPWLEKKRNIMIRVISCKNCVAGVFYNEEKSNTFLSKPEFEP